MGGSGMSVGINVAQCSLDDDDDGGEAFQGLSAG